MKLRIILLLFFLSIFLTELKAQSYYLRAENEPLDRVIERLGIEVSMNNRKLNAYLIKVDHSFLSIEQVLDYLLKDKPFTYEYISGVYIIAYKKSKVLNKLSSRQKRMVQSSSSVPEIQVLQLSEVLIKAPKPERSVILSDSSGSLALASQISRYLPGSSDNSVFTLLRMLPGIRASGEPSGDAFIWGSHSGESSLIFDGIPLLGMHGFNDNISYINPYLVEGIRVLKGAYNAHHGNQVGGIILIDAIEPKQERASIKANISTLTANLYASTPIGRRISFSAAYRRTFYDLYQSNVLNPYNGRRSSNGRHGFGNPNRNDNLYISPHYAFSDLNLNLSAYLSPKDRLRMAFYGADDRFSYRAEPQAGTVIEGQQHSRQWGSSAQYQRIWNHKHQSKVNLAFSEIKTLNDQINHVQQGQLRIQHQWRSLHHQIETGVELHHYLTDDQLFFKTDLYALDRMKWGPFECTLGLRGDIIPNAFHVQPRLSASYTFLRSFKATAAWGLYRQYLEHQAVSVGSQQFQMQWHINPQLKAFHSVLGLAFERSGLLISLEVYLKRLDHATRIVQTVPTSTEVNLKGLDLFAKYHFTRGHVFGSYSIAHNTNIGTGHEIKVGSVMAFKGFVISANYVFGKGFDVLNFAGRFDSRHGNGGSNLANADKPYSRLDLGLQYRIRIRKTQLQIGGSLMNIFNTSNVKYQYSLDSRDNPITLYSQTMPFTPMLSIEFIW